MVKPVSQLTYRALPADGVAWVTGASGGIGRATSLELARRGFTVVASARRDKELRALALASEGLAGKIEPAPVDVTDRAAIAALVARIEAQRSIVLALLNAGGTTYDRCDDFGGPGFQATFALNVQGVANCVNPVFNAMRERRRGQIAIVGSLAAYGGVPYAYAYAPSKAAVMSLAVGLKFLAAPSGVTVQLITPGYVRTPLTGRFSFPEKLSMDAGEAARRIVNGLEHGGFEIRVPRRFAYAVRAMNWLPYPAYFAMVNALARRLKRS